MRHRPKNRIAALTIAGLCGVLSGTASAGQIVFDGYHMTTNGFDPTSGSAMLDGANLQLSQSQNSQFTRVGTAYITQAYAIDPTTSFLASFNFTIQNNGTQFGNEFFPFQGNGSGFSFIVQNTTAGVDSVVGGFSPAGFGATPNSLGVQFNADQPDYLHPIPTAGTVSIITAPQTEFAAPVPGYGVPATRNFDLQGDTLALNPGGVSNYETGHVTILYDAMNSLLTVAATNSTGESVTFSDSLNLFTTVSADQPVSSSMAYFGFEAEEGGGLGALLQSEISNFSLSVGPSVSVSVPEPASIGLVVAGLAGLGLILRRRRA